MSSEKSKSAGGRSPEPKVKAASPGAASSNARDIANSPAQLSKGKDSAVAAVPPPRLFQRVDWVTMLVTTVLVFIGYLITLSPDVTLEDSGELAVGSFYAGVPHPPGYPVWAIYSWLFTVILPFSNIAWRVSVSSAVAGALACGLIALLVSRGSAWMLDGIAEEELNLAGIEPKWKKLIGLVSGVVAGMLMGFNGYFWSQAVIVEVYCLGVLTLTGVLVCLFRWMYAPEQRRYLYWAMYLFGLCVVNHQSLLIAAVGIQVAICAREPKLARDLFFLNSLLFITGLFLKQNGGMASFSSNPMMFALFVMVGISSMIACGWLIVTTRKLGTEWKAMIVMPLCWAAGAGTYFYMPLTSMTNPPMNWGYARTVEGFWHALTRGQYGGITPTSDLGRFIHQLGMYLDGAQDEFNLVYLLIALVPLLFIFRFRKRERAWVIGLVGIHLCLAVFLDVLLNPSPDRASTQLCKVFFTASHVVISMFIGYGLALVAASVTANYQRCRVWLLYGAGVAALMALYGLVKLESLSALAGFTAKFGLAMAMATIGIFLIWQKKAPLIPLLVVFLLMPSQSILSHWADNEQRGHLFGFWFGHDMFIPPFDGPDGKLTYGKKLREEALKDPKRAKFTYPEMTPKSVLFGGTDPGRFCPTYMIFCESFIPPADRRDPEFDRRDVSLITQNALADLTYLMYIRAHYNRSTQIDPPFFQEFFRSEKERQANTSTNLFSKCWRPVDNFFEDLGAKVEARRRAQGVYPLGEIHTPSFEDHQKAFEEYMQDAQRRYRDHQLMPGEEVQVADNKVQISGQVAVMAINGLLTKVIFDRNPDRDFFVEESFPLDWMYPYLAPYGIIMKINRQPLQELTGDVIERDHHFWSEYSGRLIGNWIDYDTPVTNLCAFAERLFQRADYTGFTGDPKFIRDDVAQKSFSKLRSAQAGLYAWRLQKNGQQMQALVAQLAKEPQMAPVARAQLEAERGRLTAENARMLKEAEFAFKQSFAFCPFSPEAVFRYANLLLVQERIDDALAVALTFKALDPFNGSADGLIQQLRGFKAQQLQTQKQGLTNGQATEMEAQLRGGATNLTEATKLLQYYVQTGQSAKAVELLDRFLGNPSTDLRSLIQLSVFYGQLGNPEKAKEAMAKACVLADRVLANPNSDLESVKLATQVYGMLAGQTPTLPGRVLSQLEAGLTRLTQLTPSVPEMWYELARIQLSTGRTNESLANLSNAFYTSDERLKQGPKERNLRQAAVGDDRLGVLRDLPSFKRLVQPDK